MEKLIREGALRLLMSESSCDVILSCGGYRLMAHKVILSIASPVLQELLLQGDTVPTVIIFPDISGNTMSLILDYIYSGSINVRSDLLSEFIAVANELKLQVDNDNFKVAKYFQESIEENIKPDCKFSINKKEVDIGSITHEGNHKVQKCIRKMPALLPLTKVKRKKVLHTYITPSPWAPRVTPLLANPLENHLHGIGRISRHEKQNIQRNDKNNNLQVQVNIETTPPFREISPEDNEKIDLQSSIITSGIAEVSDEINLVSKNNSNETNSMDTNNQSLNLVDEKKICVDLTKNNITNTSKQAAHIKINTSKKIDCMTIDKNLKSSRLRSDTSNSKQTDNKKCFNCEDCGKSFSQLRNFKYHRSIHEGTKEFSARCPECGKIFNDKGYLSSHMKIHRDRKEYACPQCPKRFNQRVAYNMHLRIHTGHKPHECPTCGKTFSRKMLLKQHQRVHTGERPYSCPECGKSFADRSNMSLHARLHTGVKPYTCSLCSKSFTKKHHLKTHMNFHTGLKPYSCEKCGLAFSQSSNMRTHYKRCILKDTPDSENT